MMVRKHIGAIRNRFKIALAEKEVKDGRRYTYRDIQELTGVSTSTLTDWAQGKVKNVAVDTLAALCFFFECQPSALLEYMAPSKDDLLALLAPPAVSE